MADDNMLPLSIIKANAELHLRIAQLLHENEERWQELSSRARHESIEECKAEIANLSQVQNWQTFSTLPFEAFWRQWQQRFADTQAVIQLATQAQAAVTQGLQQAAQAWQKSAFDEVHTSSAELPFTNYFKSWIPGLATTAPEVKRAARAK